MNNDAVADPAFVSELLATRGDTGAAMVAGCMVATTGTIESAGVIADQSLIGYAPYAEAFGAAVSQPLGLSGGAALYERATFVAADRFDEQIFCVYTRRRWAQEAR